MEFYDLIYGPRTAEAIIKKRYPEARITDASDIIHTERFECKIEGVTKDEFYPFAIREGFAESCLGFNLLLTSLKFPDPKDHPGEHKETITKLETWIEASKKDLHYEKEGGLYDPHKYDYLKEEEDNEAKTTLP